MLKNDVEYNFTGLPSPHGEFSVMFCLIFVCFIYIDPEQIYGINSFKGLFTFVC